MLGRVLHSWVFLYCEISDSASNSYLVTGRPRFISLWFSPNSLCVSKNLSHFFSVIQSVVSCLQHSLFYFCDIHFSMVLLCLSLPILAVTIFSPTPSWCIKICQFFCYLQKQNLVSLGFVRSVGVCFVLFSHFFCSVVSASFLHLTLGLICSYFSRSLECQLRLWCERFLPFRGHGLYPHLSVGCHLSSNIFLCSFISFLIGCLREASLAGPPHQC